MLIRLLSGSIQNSHLHANKIFWALIVNAVLQYRFTRPTAAIL